MNIFIKSYLKNLKLLLQLMGFGVAVIFTSVFAASLIVDYPLIGVPIYILIVLPLALTLFETSP